MSNTFLKLELASREGDVILINISQIVRIYPTFWEDSPLRRVRRVKVRKLERQPYTRAEVGAILEACDRSRSPERDRL